MQICKKYLYNVSIPAIGVIKNGGAYNTAYTLWAYPLALRDILLLQNLLYAGNIIRPAKPEKGGG